MKVLLTFSILFLSFCNLNAQVIRDSVFDNVILIQKEDVSTNGHDFLIDIPIVPQQKSIIIYNRDGRVPANLFFDKRSFLPEQDSVLLITLDWDYYAAVSAENKSSGIHPIPVRQEKFYFIMRHDTSYEVDSFSVRTDDPKRRIIINYAKPKLQENEVAYYYQECYGSVCCPKDANLDLTKDRNSVKSDFNEKYNVDVYKNAYRLLLGFEGEHCNLYSLSDLTNEQKIEFIHLSQSHRLIRSQNTDTGSFPIIISPTIINTNKLKPINTGTRE